MNQMLMQPNYGFVRPNNLPLMDYMHILFIQKNPHTYKMYSQPQKQKLFYLELLNQSLEFLPRKFTITTNNGSYHFNTEILKDTSSVITKILKEDPNNLQYHIDIDDEGNVMKKIEDLYLGKEIIFDIKDLLIIQKIMDNLDISNIPFFMRPNQTSVQYSTVPAKAEVVIEKSSLLYFLKNDIGKTFTILSNEKEYKCNLFGVYSSNVIRDLIEKDPDLNQFNCDFENDEIEQICKFFNFEKVQVTINNMDSLKKIAEDLQISYILEDINNFIDTYQNAVQLIDDQKMIIETNDEIFSWLHNINNLTVETVKDNIVDSIWVHSEENIQELIAFIFQVIRVGFQLHSYLIDLLIMLDQSKNETNDLDLLMPLFIKQMKFSFFNNKFYCSFIYRMSQKGLITIDEIINFIKLIDGTYADEQQKYKLNSIDIKFIPEYHNTVTLWFLPELNQIKNFQGDEILLSNTPEINKFFNMFFPNNIERFKKIRESGEPDDDLTRAILYDDVDTLQTILSKSAIDINETKLPPNLYEIFNINVEISFINYAAENGSIKCFKYLLLNHAKLDDYTFGYAVYGGNVEIIRTVNQYFHNEIKIELNNDTKFEQNNYNNWNRTSQLELCEYSKYHLLNPIIPAIIKHQNDLFDWIFEEKYIGQGIADDSLFDLAIISVKNGNAHSFIECIDKGLDLRSFSDNKQISEDFIFCSSIFGFYRITQLIFSLIAKNANPKDSKLSNPLLIGSSTSFGNLYIFEFVDKLANLSFYYGRCLVQAIERDYISIIKYIIEKDFMPTEKFNFIEIFNAAICKKTPDLFNYIKSKFNYQNLMEKIFLSLSDFVIIICEGCISGNFEAVKELTEFILQKEPKLDFTAPFIQSISSNNNEITRYFIEKKVPLDFNRILKGIDSISNGDLEIINELIDKRNPEIKVTFWQSILNHSLEKNNKKLVEFILSENRPNSKSLFAAVNSHNVEIVNLILSYNSRQSFINQVCSRGTALNVAVCNNDFVIVKRLLSLPGIDPNLYDTNNHTPLISAIINLNIDIINIILDFYGDEIQTQMWQLNDALKEILGKLSGCFDNQNQVQKKQQYDYSDYDDIEIEDDTIKTNKQDANFLLNNQSKIFVVLNRLMQIKNIDLNVHVHKYTLLTYACETNEVELLKILLKSDKVNINSYAPTNGNTPLMIAIEKKNFETAHLLIESPRVNINLKNYSGQTALTVAVTQQMPNIIDLLVNNNKFDPEESCLDYAFFISDGKISDQLCSVKGLNVNYNYDNNFDKSHDKLNIINDDDLSSYIDAGLIGSSSLMQQNEKNLYLYETTLIHAVNHKKSEMIDLIINHPSFDPIQSQVTAAIFVSVFHKELNIFKKLMNLVDNDVNLFSQSGESLLSFSIISDAHDITTEILNSDSFDGVKSDLLTAFCNAACLNLDAAKNIIFRNYEMPNVSLNARINEMNDLCEFDEQHDHLINFDQLLPNGKSFFTSISCFINNINELVQFFLDHNVDPNRPDKDGVYPLECAIQKEDYNFFSVLVNSQKIDFSIKLNKSVPYIMKNDTFLHLAAATSEDQIVGEFIDRNLIDINATNDLGETPLMKAVKNHNEFIIIKFFNSDNLDYRHRNNEGKDAIDITKNLSKNSPSFSTIGFRIRSNEISNIYPEEKKQYFLKICENFNANKKESDYIPPF